MARFSPGAILFGKYRVERLLGRGGFSEVYLVTHVRRRAPRALKVLTRGGRVTSGIWDNVARRFRLEAQLGTRFAQEPHIVRVYEFVRDREQGMLGLVMEYMPGGSLKDRIRRARRQGLPGLGIGDVVRTAYHVALGLAVLHHEGFVHRDVKPSNILYDTRDNAKIADLGVVQMQHGLTGRTQLGEAAPHHPGTRKYMSPEQEASRDYLPPASDIYSLGLTLFEALTFQNYKKLPPGARVSHFRADVPPWLDDLLAQMLDPDPRARPWDGAELARLLAPYVTSGMTQGPPPTETFSTWSDETLSEDDEATLEVTQPPPRRGRAQRPRHRARPSPQHDPFEPVPQYSGPEYPRSPQPTSARARWLWGSLALLFLCLSLMMVASVFWLAQGRAQRRATPKREATLAAQDVLGTLRAPTPTVAPRPTALPTATSSGAIRAVQLWNQMTMPDEVYSLTFSPDGALLAAGARDGTIQIWQVRDGTPVRTLRGHLWVVEGLAFSPDGTLLASGSRDKTVRIWRLSDGRLLRTLKGGGQSVWDVAFSPDGRFVAAGLWSGAVRLWRPTTGGLVTSLSAHKWGVRSVAFSPDGQYLASGAADRVIQVYRVKGWAQVLTLTGHRDDVDGLAFSPDGTLLASGSWDATVRVWRLTDGQGVYTFRDHEDRVLGVAFSPDGLYLASASKDGTVRIWRMTDGRLLYTLSGHTDWVTAVAFSPDGAVLASASKDGTVRLWNVVK